MNARGRVTNLTSNPALDTSPSPSPDGTRIAFVSSRDGQPDVYVMPAAGGRATRLTTSPFDDENVAWNDAGTTSIAWSPDSKRLAFDVQNATFPPTCQTNCVSWSVYLINADGTGLHSIATEARAPPGLTTAVSSRTRTWSRRTVRRSGSRSTASTAPASGSARSTPTRPPDRAGLRTATSSCSRRTAPCTRFGPTAPAGTGSPAATTPRGRRTARRSRSRAAPACSGCRGSARGSDGSRSSGLAPARPRGRPAVLPSPCRPDRRRALRRSSSFRLRADGLSALPRLPGSTAGPAGSAARGCSSSHGARRVRADDAAPGAPAADGRRGRVDPPRRAASRAALRRRLPAAGHARTASASSSATATSAGASR